MSHTLPTAVIDAPVSHRAIVLGAPGSGKTELLQQRFLALTGAGVSADSLMIATPTRAAAGHLRDALGLRLGVTTQGARVRSLAALAFSLVQDFHREQGLPIPDLMKASQIELDIQSLLQGHEEDGSGPDWPAPLGPEVRSTRAFRQELREWMARAGESGANSDDIRAAAERVGRFDWVAAADFRDEYRRVVASARPGAFDSGEIFVRATQALTDGLPAGWKDLRHVMVDDAHDLTHAGLVLLEGFGHQGVGITVVSEPDVAGNTFRGSEPGGHAALAVAWQVSPVILSHVFRHGPTIRAAVAEMTSRIGAAQAGKQRAAIALDTPSSVETLLAPSAQSEAFNIARIIRHAQLREGFALEDITVIARRGARVSEIVRELTLAGIPARQSMSGSSLREQSAARELVELLALGLGVKPLTSRSAVAALEGLYGGMSQQEMRRLRFAMRQQQPAEDPYQPVDVLLAEALAHRGGFALLDSAIAQKAHTLAGLLADIAHNPHGSVADALWALWEGTGAHRNWALKARGSGPRQSGLHRSLDAVVALFAQAADFVETSPGQNPAVFVDALLNSEVPEDVVLPSPLWPAVVVSTPSGVVGRESPLVIVSGVEDGVWPDLRLRGSLLAPHRLLTTLRGLDHASIDEAKVVRDDEIRLFALALSRASRRLVVTATRSEESEPSALFQIIAARATALEAETAPPVSTRSVVGALRRELIEKLDQGDAVDSVVSDLALAAQWGLQGAHPDQWWGVAPISTSQPLHSTGSIPVSPSAIAALEESPLDWFLSSVARNDPAPSRSAGLLLHQAWEHHSEGDVESLWSEVDRRFGELEYEAGWVERYQRGLARGMVEALGEYTKDRRDAGATVLGREASFRIEHERVVMRGSIDRLESTDSGEVLVVDLKTGNHQTDSAVVGNPQMLSYQLALESEDIRTLLGEHEPVSAGAVLLFVKSGVRGKTYRLATQAPLDAPTRAAFLARIEAAAAIICSHEFSGEPQAFGPPGTPARHRWHSIGQVCGDV